MSGPSAQRVFVVAHRGNSAFAPENTLAALLQAVELGADAVEVDLRLSADGEVVLLHDATLGRTTDAADVPVAALGAAEIRRADAGSWKSPEFAGERVPLLREALELLAGRCRVFAELKVRSLAGPLARLAAETGTLGQLTVLTWDKHPEDLADVRRFLPGVPVLELGDAPPDPGPGYFAAKRAAGLAGLDCKFSTVTPAFTAAARAAGMPVWVWTLNEPRDMRTAVSCGSAGITTDNPGMLLDIIAGA